MITARLARSFLLFTLLTGTLGAQSTEPRIRTTLSPAATVIVGQPLTLTVEVLVPSFFTGGPRYEQLDVPDAITIFVDRGANFTEREGGVTWAGQSRSYTIYPQRPGRYDIEGVTVDLPWMSDDRGRVRDTVISGPIRFEASVPAEAEGLGYFISTSRLGLREVWDPRPDTVRVGEAFKRTITVTVDDALSMVIPPFMSDSMPGLAIYPGQPRVSDEGGERGAQIRGTRVESVSYVAQDTGRYQLPAIELAWWDLNTRRLRTSRLDGVSITVVANPASVVEIGVPPDSLEDVATVDSDRGRLSLTAIFRRWGPSFAAMILLVAVIRFAWRRLRVPWLAGWDKWRTERAESEGVYFNRFRDAARSNDPQAAMRFLVNWLDRRTTGYSVRQLVHDAASDELTRELETLDQMLYGSAARGEWSGSCLLRAVSRARRRLRPSHNAPGRVTVLPELNPDR